MAMSVKCELGTSTIMASASQSNEERRDLRSRYQLVNNLIHDESEDIIRPDSDKFNLIFRDVESLHERVSKPREQVADAKALLNITKCFGSSMKARTNNGLTPSNFILRILDEFGERCESNTSAQDCRNSVLWKDIGIAVSGVFKGGDGCCTM